jgi:hypothetical protein
MENEVWENHRMLEGFCCVLSIKVNRFSAEWNDDEDDDARSVNERSANFL